MKKNQKNPLFYLHFIETAGLILNCSLLIFLTYQWHSIPADHSSYCETLSSFGSMYTTLGDGQGNLVCCSSWGHKELDTTEQLN